MANNKNVKQTISLILLGIALVGLGAFFLNAIAGEDIPYKGRVREKFTKQEYRSRASVTVYCVLVDINDSKISTPSFFWQGRTATTGLYEVEVSKEDYHYFKEGDEITIYYHKGPLWGYMRKKFYDGKRTSPSNFFPFIKGCLDSVRKFHLSLG